MDSKIIRLLLFFFLLPINSYATEFQGSFKQGSFILGKTNQNSEVYIDKKKVRVTKDGYFAFGIDRDRKNNVIIKVINNGKTEIIEKKIFKKKYIIQRIDLKSSRTYPWRLRASFLKDLIGNPQEFSLAGSELLFLRIW